MEKNSTKRMPALSPSIAKILTQESPFHAYTAHRDLGGGTRREQTDAMRRGQLVDHLIFGSKATVRIRAPRERVAAEVWGEIVVTEQELATANEMAQSVLSDLKHRGITLHRENAQPRWEWTADGGIACKGRPDYYAADTGILDLKTCRSLSDKTIGYKWTDDGWDLQAAAYAEAGTAIAGNAVMPVRFVCIEATEPYTVRMVDVDAVAMGEATAKWRAACALWKQCLETDTWPIRPDMTIGSGKRKQQESLDFVINAMKGTRHD